MNSDLFFDNKFNNFNRKYFNITKIKTIIHINQTNFRKNK